ncbi:hypothetical protein [Nocardiopsis aegyptia]|uniref:Uncharacterized protein n=1 Tax=Nocardiopsis aegyptia TaxID=220378 RepID=A0A7Z0JAP9_9ACTN|nr:hypothetical protein [Nocardiopsis aegyptia]NYJ35371.1 hypothetical protein [Nocardiopsis aegyptia]
MKAGLGLILLVATVVQSMLAAGHLLSGTLFHGVCTGVAATLCGLGSALAYRRAHQDLKTGTTDTRPLITVPARWFRGRSRRARGRSDAGDPMR